MSEDALRSAGISWGLMLVSGLVAGASDVRSLVLGLLAGTGLGLLCWPLVYVALRRRCYDVAGTVIGVLGATALLSSAPFMPGVGIMGATFLALLAASILVIVVVPREVAPGTCMGCGYPLRGLRGRVCPECGEAT